MSIVLIKELTSPDVINFGLEKEGRSKLPGTSDTVQPMFANGKWVTGMDETAPDVIAKGKEEIERVKAEREELERLTGFDLSPSASNPFWEDMWITINRNVAFDTTDPYSRIRMHVLRARKAVAPHPDVSSAEYPGVKYYFAKPEEEAQYKLKPKKEKAEAMAKLVELMKDTKKARLVAKGLGFSVADETSSDSMYDMFISFIDRFPKENTVKQFIEQLNIPVQEHQVTAAFEKALNRGIISNDKGTFRRGTVALGRTKKEAITKLLTIEFSGELESIFTELAEKK